MSPDVSEAQQRLFQETKEKFNSIFRDILKSEEVDAILAEAAFPAYAHKNPLINRIMWDRLRTVFNYVSRRPGSRILDYGCGSGVGSWLLSAAGHRLVMFDTEYKPLRLVQKHVVFPANSELKTLEQLQSPAAAHTFDFVIALDVLEHISGLQDNLRLFKHLLKDGGELIVSGPTENVLYRLGRLFAGRQFSGTYHVSNIRKIKNELLHQGTVTHLTTLYPLWPLFEVFAAKLEDNSNS